MIIFLMLLALTFLIIGIVFKIKAMRLLQDRIDDIDQRLNQFQFDLSEIKKQVKEKK
jgi:hypothetical protein